MTDAVNPELTVPAEVAAASAAADTAPKAAKRGPGRPKGAKTRTPAQKAAWARAQAARRAGPKAAPAARVASTSITDAKLAESVNGLYAMAGLGIGFAGLTDIGMALAGCSPDVGEAWVALARTNPALRRVLEALASTSAIGALLTAHAPLFALVIHKVNPALAGMVPGSSPSPTSASAPTGGWAAESGLGDPFPPTAAQRHAAALAGD